MFFDLYGYNRPEVGEMFEGPALPPGHDPYLPQLPEGVEAPWAEPSGQEVADPSAHSALENLPPEDRVVVQAAADSPSSANPAVIDAEDPRLHNLPVEDMLSTSEQLTAQEVVDPTPEEALLVDHFAEQLAGDVAKQEQFNSLMESDPVDKQVIAALLPGNDGSVTAPSHSGPDAVVQLRTNSDQSTTWMRPDGTPIATQQADGSLILTPTEEVVWKVSPEGTLTDVTEAFDEITRMTGSPHTVPTPRQAQFEQEIAQFEQSGTSESISEVMRTYNQMTPRGRLSAQEVHRRLTTGWRFYPNSGQFRAPRGNTPQ